MRRPTAICHFTGVMLAVLAHLHTGAVAQEDRGQELKRVFSEKHRAWLESRREVQGITSVLDRKAVFDDNQAAEEIVALGIPAVPLLLEKLDEDPFLGYVLWRITKWKYGIERLGERAPDFVWVVQEFPDLVGDTGPPHNSRVWRRWWHEGRKSTADWFADRYREWKDAKEHGRTDEAAAKYQRLKDLGLPALPLMIDKVRAGDTELVAAITYLTDGKLTQTASQEQCLGWWQANNKKYTLPPVDADETAAEPEGTQGASE